jgi:prophage DNA circulation protein
MTQKDLKEAIAATAQIITALLATIQGPTGLAGAQMVYACGELSANGAQELAAGGGQFWSDLSNCFEAARTAGATFTTMEAVRLVAVAKTPIGLPAIAVKNFAIRLALAEEVQILAGATFTSRQQIDNYFDQINASFDAAILIAADNMDGVSYAALITMQGEVCNDLSTRAFPLPQITIYSYPVRMPSLWIAQRLYQDPSRNDELILENSVIHPLFMPTTGEALSA